ncbi:MAG: ribonuclease HI family protein [Pseudomonadota bacterium]
MPAFEDLLAVAYKSDLVLGRRLQKNRGLSAQEALTSVLQQAAGDATLAELVRTRRQLKLDTAQKLETRRKASAAAFELKKQQRQPDPDAWLAWFDGSAHPNPGKLGVGGVLKSPDGETIWISRAAGQGNSGEGEYLALIAVLQEAVRRQPKKLLVYGDSQVVINDMLQAGKAGARGLEVYRMQARQLIAQLEAVTLSWIPRHKNAEADALSQKAISMSLQQAIGAS